MQSKIPYAILLIIFFNFLVAVSIALSVIEVIEDANEHEPWGEASMPATKTVTCLRTHFMNSAGICVKIVLQKVPVSAALIIRLKLSV